MKTWSRLLFGLALALFAAGAAHAQVTATGISASPGSAKPGDQVTFTVNASNTAVANFSGTANFSIVVTHLITGASFTITQNGVSPVGGFVAAATSDPATGQNTPGAGTFNVVGTVPTQFTQAGAYRATVTMTPAAQAASTFSVNTGLLTVTGSPDLQITRLDYTASTSYVGGTVINMSLDYRNNASTNGTPNVPYTPGTNGLPSFVRIKVVLSTNPTFGDADDFQLTIQDISGGNVGTVDNAGNPSVNADGVIHTFNWQQVLPGNFAGSYYVLAKIDALDQLTENDPPALTVNGNNVWGGNTLNPSGTLINLLPTNFPATILASHGTGALTTASGYSDNPSITSDGRYLAFASDATNLVAGDTNSARDVFVFDSQTTLVRRLSLSQQGAQANGASNNPVISGNGRYVAFASEANNLIIGDTNGFSDIYAVDTITGLISRISVATGGTQANNPSFKPAISDTGRYVVFQSTATNLVTPATTVGVSHIYLRDRDVSGSGVFDTPGNTSTTLIDVTPANVAGNGSSIQPAISANGRYVAFASDATDLVAAADLNGKRDVFVRDRNAAVATATRMVSVQNGTGVQGDGDSQTPSLNSDGHYVAFASLATNLVAGDTNGISDIFVYDTTVAVGTPTVVRVSVSTAGVEAVDPSAAGFKLGSINPTISANGRYVAYSSLANNLTAGDTSGQYQATDANNAIDVFVHDRQVSGAGAFDVGGNIATQMVSVNTFGYQTNGLLGVPSTAASNIYPVISADGRFVAFPSDAENTAGLAFGATNLLPLDSNGLRDVFVFDRRTTAPVTPGTPPTVTITSPGNNGTALVNTAIPINASATTNIGVVSSVQFFVNGASQGTSTVFPYTQTWTPTAVGTYTLSAIVTDSFGNIGVSPNVTVTINAAPSVGVTSPVAEPRSW